MTGKLDQPLESIVASTRRNTKSLRRNRPRRSGAPGTAAKPASTAPVGGVKKNVKPQKKAEKPIPTGPASKGEGKIIISNLPTDVNETQIKEYLVQSVGHVKKVMLVYGPNGQSRGIANITFSKPDDASKAVSELNGVKVDNRAMKVELVLDGRSVPAVPEKKLSDRITAQPKQPKQQKATPKPATADKPKSAADKRKAGRGKKAAGRGGAAGAGRAGRPKKSAEDLDAEMVDYWGAPAGGEGASGATTAAPGEVAMTE